MDTSNNEESQSQKEVREIVSSECNAAASSHPEEMGQNDRDLKNRVRRETEALRSLREREYVLEQCNVLSSQDDDVENGKAAEMEQRSAEESVQEVNLGIAAAIGDTTIGGTATTLPVKTDDIRCNDLHDSDQNAEDVNTVGVGVANTEQAVEESSAPEPEAPRLQRDVAVPTMSRPGAFAFSLNGTTDSFDEESPPPAAATSTGEEEEGLGGHGSNERNMMMMPWTSTDSANSIEPVAMLVQEEDEEARIQTRAVQVRKEDLLKEERERSLKRREIVWRYLMGGAICILIFVSIAVGVTQAVRKEDTLVEDSTGDQDASMDVNQTEAPIDIQEHILSLLPERTVFDILVSTSTPQQQAFDWLLQDPRLDNYTDNRIVQRFALATFYLATGGPLHWLYNDGWLSYDTHECDWYSFPAHGFYDDPENDYLSFFYEEANATNTTPPCNQDTGSYERLWLKVNNLRGPIPEELYLLSSLESISIERNDLTGTISTQISRLSNLRRISLGTNPLTGELPSELGRLTQLQQLLVTSILGIFGKLPSEIGLMDSLTFAVLDQNGLTGTFPTEIGLLSNLEFLWITGNKLTGPIPSEMGNMESLGFNRLDSNGFTGTVPTEVGNMGNMSKFIIHANTLAGALPSELGLCSSLTQLVIGGNALSGNIPSDLGRLSLLEQFHSWANPLSGSMPTEIGQWKSMKGLELANARLIGTIPSEVGQLSQLEFLNLDTNQLSGKIPSEVGQIQGLWRLWLHANDLSGKIPSEIGNVDNELVTMRMNSTVYFQNMTEFRVENNKLTGTVPSQLGRLSHLQMLSLFNNSGLNGTVPSSLCLLDSWPDDEADVGGISVDCEMVECSCGSICKCL